MLRVYRRLSKRRWCSGYCIEITIDILEIVQTLILRFANMEKLINSLNLSTPIFRTLQYSEAEPHAMYAIY